MQCSFGNKYYLCPDCELECDPGHVDRVDVVGDHLVHENDLNRNKQNTVEL